MLNRITGSRVFLPLAMLFLCLIIYGKLLLGYRYNVVSASGGDIEYWFYYVRQFGFKALHHGQIPQWNPHIYGGAPFFGGWQAALLYPLNWMYLVLPLNLALNIEMMTSSFLAGLFGALLARKQGLTPISSLLSGAILMFGGPFFSHVWSGHLSALAAMAWTPLILLAAETIIEGPGLGPLLLAAFAWSMQILAGHPQTVFNTALMLIIYVGARLIRIESRARIVATLFGAAALAGAVGAVQILTGIEVSTEGARAGGLGYWPATTYSYPPENMLTNLSPFLYGDIAHVAYWGRWKMWETASYISMSALPLIGIGLFYGSSRRRWIWAWLALALILMAMGRYTPLFRLVYTIAPLLNRFRAPCRFLWETSIFTSLLAGAGLDAMLSGSAKCKIASRCMLAICGALATSGASLKWRGIRIVSAVYKHINRHNNPNAPSFRKVELVAVPFAAHQLLEAAAIALVIGLILHECRGGNVRKGALALAGVCLLELLCYAHAVRGSFVPETSKLAQMKSWGRTHTGDFRILQKALPMNSAMTLGLYDASGYDPMVMGRYQKLLDAANVPALDSTPDDKDVDPSPALQLLRCKYIIDSSAGKWHITECDDPLPSGLMIYDFEIMKRSDAILDELVYAGIDPKQTVILSARPPIGAVKKDASGIASVTWKNSDTMCVDAITSSPGVLLITNAYSKFWKATALAGSSQLQYRIEPADYALMGIPVRAGHHRLMLQYSPPLFRTGAVISILGLAAFAVLGAIAVRSSRQVYEL